MEQQELNTFKLKKVIKEWVYDNHLTTLMSLDQKEIPKRLSSDHIDFVVKLMLEKSPLFRVLNMSLYSLDVSNGYFTKDDKFKDDELDAFVSIGSILRLEFGEAGINKIVDKKNIKSDVYTKILSSRVLLPVYILILYKDIIFIEAERAAIERILLRGNSGTEYNNLTQQG